MSGEPSPKDHCRLAAWPVIWAVIGSGLPATTVGHAGASETDNGPLRSASNTSSQPVDGGLAQSSASISSPVAEAESPTPRQGEVLARWNASTSCGSKEMLPLPLESRVESL